MPGLAQRKDQLSNGVYSVGANGFWSKQRDDLSYNQLQKFWSELSPLSRQKLLQIDKQTLFEQARKNMYCSRCNGLLLEGFLHIIMYGKSPQQEGGAAQLAFTRRAVAKNQIDGSIWNSSADCCLDEFQDPSAHPWGGLTATRDGSLTLLDCYLYSNSMKGLQNVFDSARGRERERELLYPDACGGGGRGWISQGIVSYARVHGTRESCALHTARLSCDTLVDFWSALGEETRQSLSRMKEEDFIERLMYRFDSKRFCRDCRRNVIREFKELKELKRIKRQTRCTSWFCVADTAFQYEVTEDSIHADWHQTFSDSIGAYHHFEWAVGTGEGKHDILGFENVGTNGSVHASGLDLGGLNACYITLRAWKFDGRCTEFCVKAHALKGQQCVHCRLIVGDGFVTITRGESIRRFFEHAEEAEEEEDDDSLGKDGNELDGECSRPQRHAKSPELAREFLLDAATVIFKEQVEKAFREGTARQNAHSIFVCLALKLLEERVHVACKEIITMEKQMKLLEEEEAEKREEEERKERKRTKEREKKLRRKERLKGKDKDKEKPCCLSVDALDEPSPPQAPPSDAADEDASASIIPDETLAVAPAPEAFSSPDNSLKDKNDAMNGKVKVRKEFPMSTSARWPERRRFSPAGDGEEVVIKSEMAHCSDESESARGFGFPRHPRANGRHKFHCPSKVNDFLPCSCYSSEYRVKGEPYLPPSRAARERRSASSADLPKQFHRAKYGQIDPPGRSRGKHVVPHSKKVWEPMDSQKKYPRSCSDSDVTNTKDRVSGSSSEADGKACGAEADVISGNEPSFSPEGASDRGLDCSSSSDNCSSCLGEGDNSPSSDLGNVELHSVSDADDCKDPNCSQNDSSPSHEMEERQSADGISDAAKLNIAAQRDGSEQASVFSSLPNQHMQFALFQGPAAAMGYYHHNPVAWNANGYVPYSHGGHYLYAGPLGYANSQMCMQCGPVQHFGSSVAHHGPFPAYHPPPKMKTEEQINRREAAGENIPELNGARHRDDSQNSFSLFHFGGPVELRGKHEPLLSKYGGDGGLVSPERDEDDPACAKEPKMEEYNLFATSNSIRFSIF